jgi:SAM-dependent methyltransferase
MFTKKRGFIYWIFKGKTVLRSLINQQFVELPVLSGSVVDIGGTRIPTPSYMEVLPQRDAHFTVVNIDAKCGADVLADASLLPMPDATFDAAVCFNLLEHVQNPQQVVKEIARVLKPGARCYIETPFLVKVHGHPQDYHRFTDTALRELAANAGFQVQEIQALGGGPFLAAAAQVQAYIPRLVFFPTLVMAQAADWGVKRLRPQQATAWPLGYLLSGTKL